jgi:hypothetical protein
MAKSTRQDAKKVTDKTPAKKTATVKTARAGSKARKPSGKTSLPPDHSETDAAMPAAAVNLRNPIPETEMEVHHHPQLDHSPKAWKEYLLEGLMIFIAVMMGFIAENIRESITNHEHVSELTAQLAQDLSTDINQLDIAYREELKISKANNTLINLLQQPLKKEDIVQVQQQVGTSHSMWPFHPSMGAVDAIKKELHLRQFSNSKIISYISEYERHTDLLHTVQDITLQYQRSFIDPFLLKHLTAANLTAVFNKTNTISSETRNLSQEDLTQLGVDMVLIRINTEEVLRDNRKVKNDAVKLLQYVKERYHPDEK